MFCPEGKRESGPSKGQGEGSLTEAEEQCVHTHAIDAEEAIGNQVGADDHCLGDGTGTVSILAPAQGNPHPPSPSQEKIIPLLISLRITT